MCRSYGAKQNKKARAINISPLRGEKDEQSAQVHSGGRVGDVDGVCCVCSDANEPSRAEEKVFG